MCGVKGLEFLVYGNIILVVDVIVGVAVVVAVVAGGLLLIIRLLLMIAILSFDSSTLSFLSFHSTVMMNINPTTALKHAIKWSRESLVRTMMHRIRIATGTMMLITMIMTTARIVVMGKNHSFVVG